MTSLFLFLCFSLASAATDEFQDDPYLAFRPPFARSLPVQIMLTGVVLTLVAVLFIHLMFTGQYHWPLAPVNYVLQLSGVTTLLISLIATIHVVLSTAFAESEKWPYMFSYIAVNVPPLDTVEGSTDDSWSTAEKATWLVMNASTSGLIQITHIQFLTLLYPSKLEGRLIFALLGPLAVVAAVMQLLAISSTAAVQDIAEVVRNVCNATLSLLFTLALFIWGTLVNRKQAWRTDGGTAVFGCAALSLAVVSTALNFLYIHKAQEFVWLPGLMWAVVLWQSFLGWWWWVGAGSGGTFGGSSEDEGERFEEKIRKQQKREARRKEAREKRKANKMRAQKVLMDVARFIPGSSSSSSGHSTSAQSRDPSSMVHTRTRASGPGAPTDVSGPATLNTEHNAITLITSASTGPTLTRTTTINTLSSTSTVTSTSLVTSTSYMTDHHRLPRFFPAMVHRWYAHLRHAHNAAARVQAAERVERIRELEREREREREREVAIEMGGGGGDVVPYQEEELESVEGHSERAVVVEGVGWGWEGFGWRWRRKNRNRALSGVGVGGTGRLKGGEVDGGLDLGDSRAENDMYAMGYTSGRRSSRERDREVEEDDDEEEEVEEEEDDDDDMYVSEVENDPSAHQRQRRRRREIDDEDPDQGRENENSQTRYISSLPLHNLYFDSSSSGPPPQPLPPQTAIPAPVAMDRPRSVWWWGPLRRWRLQDSTVYK